MQTATLTKTPFGDYYQDERGEEILCTSRVNKFFFWFRRPNRISIQFSKEKFPGAKRFFIHRDSGLLDWSRSGCDFDGRTLLHSTIPYLAQELGSELFTQNTFAPVPIWVSIKKL